MELIKYLGIVILIVTLNVSGSMAQNLDEIIDKHIEAHGGADNWNKIDALKITGNFTGFSTVKNFTTIQKHPNLYRSNYSLGNFNVVLAFDGNSGWTIDPWFDVSFPRVLNTSEENVVKQKAEICSPFLNYKQKGYTVEYLGKEQVEGVDAIKLKLVRKNGRVETWYLNAETYLEYKQESIWDDFGYPTPQETFFDDFRKIGDIILPFYVERSFLIRNRMTEISSVEINPTVADGFFQMPASPEMKKFDFMSGKWAVKIEILEHRGWRTADSTSTTISIENNLLRMELAYENYIKYINQVSISYHTDSSRYVMTIYNSFDAKLNVYSGLFLNDTLAFKNSNSQKYSLIILNSDSFLIESSSSPDKGQSWRVNDKFYFTRIDE